MQGVTTARHEFGSEPAQIDVGFTGQVTAYSTVAFLHKGELHCPDNWHTLSRNRDGHTVTVKTPRQGLAGQIRLDIVQPRQRFAKQRQLINQEHQEHA